MASPPDNNLVISAALAEYTALRAEVTNRISGQDTMLTLYMTAVAAIFGFALSGHADLQILLVLPLLSAAVRLLYHNHNQYIRLLSAYLDDQLRPLVTDRLGEPGLLGWHERSTVYQRGPRWRRLAHPAGLGLLFPVPAAVALVLVTPRLSSPWAWLAWACGWLLVLAQVVLTSQPVSSVGLRRCIRSPCLVGGPAMRTGTSEPRDRASWTLAASVHRAVMDHGTWSSRRRNPHA